jgi:nitroreductase
MIDANVGLSGDLVREVVGLASLAPSIHNTQPWRWRRDGSDLALFADPSRMLPVADPDGRQLLLSCGAALAHARLALRAHGLEPSQTLGELADGRAPTAAAPLATIRVVGSRPASPDELALVAAMRERHTDRRPFQARPLDGADLAALRGAAEAEAAWLTSFDDPDLRIEAAVLLAHADWIETHDPAYVAELRRWSRTEPGAADGIPRTAVAAGDDVRRSEFVLRDFDVAGTPGVRFETLAVERPTVVAIGTDADRPADRLLAGAALGRVLLAATARGAAASPLGQAVDVASARELLRQAAGGTGHIQMLLRVGYPEPGAGPLEPTPRREVDDILDLG